MSLLVSAPLALPVDVHEGPQVAVLLALVQLLSVVVDLVQALPVAFYLARPVLNKVWKCTLRHRFNH